MYKITIDPGHGGTDRANRGPTGYVEADGVLAISKYLKAELLKTGQFEVQLTRETDATVALAARATVAVNMKADLFISEHTNASGKVPNTTVRGCEVYESVDLADESLAGKLAVAVAAALGIPSLGAKSRESVNYPGEDYYTVVDVAQDGGVPHVLLCESAFHDNALDEALLKVDANLKKIAVAQAKVICDFFKVQYPPVPPVVKHSITGPQVLTAAQLDAFARKVNPSAPALAALYLKYGAMEGIRGDIAFCQSIHETNYWRYGGTVTPDQNNFAGIGTTGATVKGAYFQTTEEGVVAQIQHLKAYASTGALVTTEVDPRFDLVTRGSAPNWEDLNGKWAVPGTTYGQTIYALYTAIAATTIPAGYVIPDNLPKPTVALLTPQACTVVQGTTVTVSGSGTNCHHIGLFVDGEFKASQNGNNFSFGLTFATPGMHTVQLKGRNTAKEQDYGTILAESGAVIIQVVQPVRTMPDTEIGKVNEAIKYLGQYFDGIDL